MKSKSSIGTPLSSRQALILSTSVEDLMSTSATKLTTRATVKDRSMMTKQKADDDGEGMKSTKETTKGPPNKLLSSDDLAQGY